MIVKGLITKVFRKEEKEGNYGSYTLQNVYINEDGVDIKVGLFDQEEVPKTCVGKEIILESAEQSEYKGATQYKVNGKGSWQIDGIEKEKPTQKTVELPKEVTDQSNLKNMYRVALETVCVGLQNDALLKALDTLDKKDIAYTLDVSAMVNTLVIQRVKMGGNYEM